MAELDPVTPALLSKVWKTSCTVLIFFMQLGFAMLEVGSCRKKHANTVLLKNVLDALVSIPVSAWVLSYSSLTRPDGSVDLTELLFQAVFANTAATIVSGAMAERLTVTSYFFVTLVLSSVVYPLVAAGAWGQDLILGRWLEFLYESADLGEHRYHDYAGSGVVHVTGALTAFVGAGFVGARLQVRNYKVKYRFDTEGLEVDDEEQEFSGWSPHMQVMGAVILWFGWFGFNTGASVSGIEVVMWNTTLVPCVSGATGFIRWWWSPTLNHFLAAFPCIAAPPLQYMPPVPVLEPPDAGMAAGPAAGAGGSGGSGSGGGGAGAGAGGGDGSGGGGGGGGGGGDGGGGGGGGDGRGGGDGGDGGGDGGGHGGCGGVGSGGGAWAAETSTRRSCLQLREHPISFVCNCVLSGLVAITAACDIAHGWQPVLLGVVVGLLYPVFALFVQWLKFDDPVNAIAVHLFPGLIGVFFVAFIKPNCDVGAQLCAQLLGLLVFSAWTAILALVSWIILAASDATLAAQHDQFRATIDKLTTDFFTVPVAEAHNLIFRTELPQSVCDLLYRDYAWGLVGTEAAGGVDGLIDVIRLQADFYQLMNLKSIADPNERLKWQKVSEWLKRLVRMVRENFPALGDLSRLQEAIGKRDWALLDYDAREALKIATSGGRVDEVLLKFLWEQIIHEKMHSSSSGFWRWFKRHWCKGRIWTCILTCKRRRIHSFFPRLRLHRTAELEGLLLFLGHGVGGLETPADRLLRLRGFQIPEVDRIIDMPPEAHQGLVIRLLAAARDAGGLDLDVARSLEVLAMTLQRRVVHVETIRMNRGEAVAALARL